MSRWHLARTCARGAPPGLDRGAVREPSDGCEQWCHGRLAGRAHVHVGIRSVAACRGPRAGGPSSAFVGASGSASRAAAIDNGQGGWPCKLPPKRSAVAWRRSSRGWRRPRPAACYVSSIESARPWTNAAASAASADLAGPRTLRPRARVKSAASLARPRPRQAFAASRPGARASRGRRRAQA